MAAEKTDLKRMVASFHIPELQILLGLLKLNKYGRKAELVQRAQAAVARGVPRQIHEEIKQLYSKKFSVRQYIPELEQRPSKPAPVAPLPAPSSYYPGSNMYSSNVMPPSHHAPPSAAQPLAVDRLMPVHPDVRLKPLPFYDMMAELLKPSTLVSRGPAGCQEAFFSFHLTPHQSQNISSLRDVQVQMRFCMLETSCDQADKFPSGIGVRVNGKPAQLPAPIPTNKLGVEPKRPGLPVNITPQCHLSAAAPNHIQVAWNPEIGRNFCIGVYLVTQLNSDILLQRLRQNGVRHPYHTRALVKEKLAADLDSEIATTSLRISLLCPLSKVRMRLPCRASTCSHLQCFDASTFLQMNEKKPTWMCPICDKPAEFNKLIIDGMFSDILTKEKLCNEIQFTEDGNWKVSMPDGEEYVIPDSPPSAKRAKVTSSDEADTTTANGQDSAKVAPPLTETIDLTGSDDEDEADGLGNEDDDSISDGMSWPSFLDAPPVGRQLFNGLPSTITSSSLGSDKSSPYCELLPSLHSALSAHDSSSSSIITIDTPPPPAHSPYMSQRAAHSSGSGGSLNGLSPRPPPAHSNSSASRSSWIVARGPLDMPELLDPTSPPRRTDCSVPPLSLTLRRARDLTPPSASITLSSSSSSSYDSS